MKTKSLRDDQFEMDLPGLREVCPCGSEREFAYCCGKEQLCDCRSGLNASDCCFTEAGSPPPRGLIRPHGFKRKV